MALLINLSLFIISCVVLVATGGFLVKSLSKISRFLRLSEFVVAFILMAVSTSLPELFVGITSALAHNSVLALGTVIGSNIADLTLVGGIIALLGRKIRIEPVVRKDAGIMIFMALLPMVLMVLGRSLSRLDGLILLLTFIGYMWYLVTHRPRPLSIFRDRTKKWEPVVYTVLFLASIIVLYFSAGFVVKYGTLLSFDLALPVILVGLFFVAVGTSLPELVFESQAVLSKHSSMAFGDLIGSVVANSTLVLGVTALIFPIGNHFMLFWSSALFMMIVAVIFATFVISGKKLTWLEGVSLVLLYVFFIVTELILKGYFPTS